MAKSYSYPRVTISQYAKTRSSVAPEPADTTILFMPFIAEKGPFGKDENLKKIHSLGEFIDKYGQLDFSKNGETALVIYNWLNNGGTLLPFRLNNYSAEKTDKTEGSTRTGFYKESTTTDGNTSYSGKFFVAKYLGSFYDSLTIKVTPISKDEGKEVVQLSVYSEGSEVERFRLTPSTYENLLSASNYIEIDNSINKSIFMKDIAAVEDLGVSKNLEVENATGASEDDLHALVNTFWGEAVDTQSPQYCMKLSNPLESEIDILLDPGYPAETKEKIVNFVSNAKESSARPDIIAILSSEVHSNVGCAATLTESTVTGKAPASHKDNTATFNHTNVALYAQCFTVHDEIFTDRDIYVSPAYFLSKLIPYNDRVYGVQYPVAGLRRGILEDAKEVCSNPTPTQKDTWFNARINYCEKSSREYAFMSQRTWDGSSEAEYTSLSFLNNARALAKMRKEIERLGREYLFEHNDAVTLSQMSNVLNKYMATWIANRTLSYAEVQVMPNPYSTEAVNVNLTIRFNNTIEVISVDITIE